MVYFNLTGIGVGLLFRRERRQRERYQELSQELERANRQLKETEERRRMASLGELAAGVAHEVRTPLNSIRGFAEFLQSDYPSGDPKRKFAEVIVAEAERLEKVVSDFLAFARPSDLHFEKTEVESIIERSLKLVEEIARRQRVQITTDYAPAIPSVLMDAEQMEQVFLNLLTNSIQAMPGGGRLSVRVAVDPSEKRMLVQVQDTGVGIRSGDVGKLFEPFFTTKRNGTGLGLSIAKRIVDGHRGEVRVESQPGCGSVFIVSLPITEDGGGS
jgi:signal transduction histidine kinase